MRKMWNLLRKPDYEFSSLFFQRKLYCKHFLSKTYPAIVASRRQKHDHQSEKDEEKDEEKNEEEGTRYIDITGICSLSPIFF